MSAARRTHRSLAGLLASALMLAGIATVAPPIDTPAAAAEPDVVLADFETFDDSNQVSNAAFEEVDGAWPAAWRPWNAESSDWIAPSTQRAHTGARSVRLEDPNTSLGVGLRSNDIPVAAGSRYTASAYVFNESGSLDLYVEFWNSSGQRIATAHQTASGQGSWSKVTVRADAPTGATHATVLPYVTMANQGVSFVDDTRLVPTVADTAIPNESYEDVDGSWPVDWRPWNAESSSQISSSTARAHTGSRSVRLDDPTAAVGVGLRSADIPADPGRRYTASAYVFNESGSIDLYLEFWNSSGQRIATANQTHTSQGSWSKATVSGWAPANAAYVTVLPFATTANQGVSYVDDVALAPADPLGGATMPAPDIDNASVTGEFSTQGTASMRLDAAPFQSKDGKVFPRVWLNAGSTIPKVGWGQHTYLHVGMVNASPERIPMYVVVWDERGGDRHLVREIWADPYEYKVFQIRTADIAVKEVDLNRISRIQISTQRALHAKSIYVDDVRLTDNAANIAAEEAAAVPALVELMDLPGLLDTKWDQVDAARADIASGSAEPETTLRATADGLRNRLQAFGNQIGCTRNGQDLTCADPSPVRNDLATARSVWLGLTEMRWDIGRFTGKVDARVASPSSPVGFGFADSMSRVYPRELPCDCAYARSTEMDMVRGEHESAQLVAVPYGGGLTNARVEANVTAGPSGGMSADAHPVVSLNMVPPVGQRLARPTDFRPSIYEGWTPDPIQTADDTVDVAAGDLQAYWVALETTPDAAPGEYSVELTFTATGVAPQTSTLAVTVHDAQIEAEPELRTAIGHSPAVYAGAYGVTDPQQVSALVDEKYEFLGEYLLQGDNIYRSLYEANPPSVASLQRIDQQYGGLRQFNIWYFDPRTFNLNNPSTWNAQADQLFNRIQPYVDQYRAAGLIDKAYLYCCDETRAEYYDLVRHVLTRFKQRFPDIRVLTAMSDDNMGRGTALAQLQDWWVRDVPWHNQAIIDERHAAGDEAWWYLHQANANPTPNVFVNYDPGPLRTLLGPMSHQANIDGFLYYRVDRWQNGQGILDDGPLSSWEPRTWRQWSGDGSLLYPGPDGPIPSIRLENMRDGLEDYNLLAALRRAIDNAPGSTDPGLIDRAEHLLGATDVVTDNYEYVIDPGTYRAWRADVAEVVADLT